MLSIPRLQSVGLLVGLRWRGIRNEDHGPVLARLVVTVNLLTPGGQGPARPAFTPPGWRGWK